MKKTHLLTLIVIFGSFICVTDSALAKAKKGKTQKTQKETLSTNVEFDPMTVHGRYQYAAEGQAKVEDEKVLYDLLGPRKNFKDRIQQMAKQR